MKNPATSLSARLQGALRHRRARGAASFMEVERAERIFYLEYLREGMTVFDVGANVGELTLLFSRFTGDEGHVHAFEAGTCSFERLQTICRAASRRNVTLNHLALADKEGTARLHVYPDAYLSWSSQAERPLEDYGINVKPVAVEDVRATTVDLYCELNHIESIDLLKVDVEGAEFQVLLGAERMLRAKLIRCVAFEFGQTTFEMGNRPDDIETFFRATGYTLRNIIKTDPIFPGREGVQSASYSMHIATP